MFSPTPPHLQDMIQGQFFKWNLTGLNSKFSSRQVGIPMLKSSVYPTIHP